MRGAGGSVVATWAVAPESPTIVVLLAATGVSVAFALLALVFAALLRWPSRWRALALMGVLETGYCALMVPFYRAPDEAGSYVSAPIRLPPGALVRRVDWTWHRPASLPDDYAQIELLTPAATQYLWVTKAASASPTPASPDPQSWAPERTATGPFRFRVDFLRRTPLPPDQPLLDSPVLDDLTVLYESPGGCRILGWE